MNIDEYVLFFGCLAIIIIMFILDYVFFALAFYRFVKNRNMKRAFLAWIPFTAPYVIGKIYDDIHKNQGKKTNLSLILDSRCFWFLLAIFIPFIPIPLKIFIVLSLYFAIAHKEFNCYKLIFTEYAPSNSNYILLTKIFMTIPILPLVPALFLWKASQNQHVSKTTNN